MLPIFVRSGWGRYLSITWYQSSQTSRLCPVSSQDWRTGIHQIAQAALFLRFSTMWLLYRKLLEETAPRDEFQIAKWGDLSSDCDFERNPGWDALRSVRSMDRTIRRVHYKWWGASLNKYQWVDMPSLPVCQIESTTRTSGTYWTSRFTLKDCAMS
jgi:hypothetical protein